MASPVKTKGNIDGNIGNVKAPLRFMINLGGRMKTELLQNTDV